MADASAELLQALQLACSQNPEELKVGEEKLSAWKREKGFYTQLAVSTLSVVYKLLHYTASLYWRIKMLVLFRACSVTDQWMLE